jgi:hypothetical protein
LWRIGLNSHKVKEDKFSQESDNLEQLIFSFAKESGLEKWIEYDKDMDKYVPTADMEDEFHIHIDKYNLKTKKH